MFGVGGPRKMGCFIPRLGSRKAPVTTDQITCNEIQENYRSGNLSNIQVLVNRTPKWNEKLGG